MAMNEKAVETATQQSILEILEDCETGIFADVEMQGDKKGITGKCYTGVGKNTEDGNCSQQ